MLFSRVTLSILIALAPLRAQFDLVDKAPPQVDEALRDRVGKFYQAHVDGKFRMADRYVAEDSKDAFFEADKSRYKGWRIAKVEYSENYTRAKVVTACATEFHHAAEIFAVNVPVVSTWKLENGEWFWYYVAPTTVETPFGMMQGGAAVEKPAPPAVPNIRKAAADILRKVSIDRSAVMLSSYEPAHDAVELVNGMPGDITLRLEYQGFPGLSIRLDRTTVKAGDKARVLLDCEPRDKEPKPTVTARLVVEPTGQVLPITVKFAVPPALLNH